MTNKKYKAIVTGGTRGLGLAMVNTLVQLGYEVAALDYTQHLPLPNEVVFYQVDLSQPSNIQAFFETYEQQQGICHVLVNNAAIAHFEKPLSSVTDEELYKLIGINLSASIAMARGFVALRGSDLTGEPEYGRIVNIASTRFQQNEPHKDLYGASKGGIVSFTISLCNSLANTGITVNTISPGWIETGDYAAIAPHDHAFHPSGRVGKPEDIAKALRYLIDPENDFVNGTNLVVDGGVSKMMIYPE